MAPLRPCCRHLLVSLAAGSLLLTPLANGGPVPAVRGSGWLRPAARTLEAGAEQARSPPLADSTGHDGHEFVVPGPAEALVQLPPLGRIRATPAPKLASRRSYFKPDSTTLNCVTILTLECVAIYVALAFSRSVDEFSGRMKPSLATETFHVASRFATLPPMFCVLCVAFRMHVDLVTNSEGRAPFWARSCMVVATVGMSLQFLVILLLPLVVDHGDQGAASATFVQKAGVHSDAHPLGDHKFIRPWVEGVVCAAQVSSLAMIYSGIAGVVAAVIQYQLLAHFIPSAAVCMLALPFCASFFALAMVRLFSRIDELVQPFTTRLSLLEQDVERLEGQLKASHAPGRPPSSKLLDACQSVCSIVLKVPMLAILFLTVCIRSQELDPPHGQVPFGVSVCFYAVAGFVYLEMVGAAYVGATGTHVGEKHGVHTYSASKLALAGKYLAGVLALVAAIPVALAIVHIESLSGAFIGLSTAVKGVLYLQGVFFVVHTSQRVVLFLNEAVGAGLDTLQESLLAAGLANRVIPSLCVLFLMAEMHVLRLTNGEGSMPAWAQVCVHLCVYATSVQVACCLAMPVILDRGAEVDADGNPEYNQRPFVAAYMVAFVKHTALVALNGGAIALCVSIYTTTAESASHSREVVFSMRELSNLLAITLLIGAIASVFSSARVLGLLVKFAIESLDKSLLGTDIVVEKAAVNLCGGFVYISGLKVQNPPMPAEDHSTRWRSPCMLSVEKLVFDMDLWELVRSRGQHFEISCLILHGAHAYVEKPSRKVSSNLAMVLDRLQEKCGPLPAAEPSSGPPAPAAAAEPVVTVRKVSIVDIAATAIPPPLFGSGFELHLGDINFDDMTDRMKNTRGAAADIVSIILHTILSTLHANSHHHLLNLFPVTMDMVHSPSGRSDRTRALGAMAAQICTPCSEGIAAPGSPGRSARSLGSGSPSSAPPTSPSAATAAPQAVA